MIIKQYYIPIGLVLRYMNHCRLFNAKSCLYIYVICKLIFWKTFLNEPELFLHRVKWLHVLLYKGHNLIPVICLHTVYR